jgi:hypothetical protein
MDKQSCVRFTNHRLSSFNDSTAFCYSPRAAARSILATLGEALKRSLNTFLVTAPQSVLSALILPNTCSKRLERHLVQG